MSANTEKPKEVNVTINGKAVTVPAGTNLLEACDKSGSLVPRYCYHPDLSIAGVCRMCVVDIEKNPKLQISCNTTCTEGMVVNTNTPRVKEAVKSALELHLINHPLDCPICDKAGECKLQDFYQEFGQYKSRMEMDQKVHKPKVQDIGTIVLDSERCILCTRCVRFTAEVTHTHELGIFNRGDRSELRTYDSGPLRNDYTGNLADICPVGALTAKDFRFRQRVWFLEKTSTVCGMCSTGCNTAASKNPSTKKVFRVEPRRNPEVNKSWMCDRGRWGYHHLYDKRVEVPRQHVDGRLEQRTWDYFFSQAKDAITADPAKTLVGLGTHFTNEELVDLVQGFKDAGVKNFTWLVNESVVDEKAPWDSILQRRDLSPNAEGFRRTMKHLGQDWMKQSDAIAKAKGFTTILWLGVEGTELTHLEPFTKAIPAGSKWFVHATNESPLWERAFFVAPNTTAFEKSGTMVNAQGRWQKLNAVVDPYSTSRDGHAVAFGLAQGNDREQVVDDKAKQVFESFTAKYFGKAEANYRKFAPAGVTI